MYFLQLCEMVSCLDRLEQQYKDKPVVIVPGGGAFADQVRLAQGRWQFDDTTAHRMAILAMQQMALLIHGLKSHWPMAESTSRITEQLNTHNVSIWSPDIKELQLHHIAESWDITSDSLAAWLANKLCAERLTLVKSTPIDQNLNLQELSQVGVIDKSFYQFVTDSAFKIDIVHQTDL